MSIEFIICIVVTFIAGLICGSIITRIILKAKTGGVLRVDRSDSHENPYLFLELSKEIKYINKKYITLRIVLENYISNS